MPRARVDELARTVGHQRAELLAHPSTACLLMETGAAEEMLHHANRAGELAAALESKRFAPRALHYRAKAHLLLGDMERVRDLIAEAHVQCHEGDAAFVGPSAGATLAAASKEPQERRRLLGEARDLIERGTLLHNVVEYHREAIEVALDERDAVTARAHTDALEVATAHEPTPFTDCLVERARLLAAQGEGNRSAETRAVLHGRTFCYVLSEIGYADFFAGALATMPVLLPRAQVAGEATAEHWVAELTRCAEEGTIFGAINFYTCLLRPAG